MADHLGHGKNEPVENPASNTREGTSTGDAQRDVRRAADRNFSRPPRHLRATVDSQAPDPLWMGFNDKILSLYARGITVREIQPLLEEMYGTEVSPTLISTVTDTVIEEAKAWHHVH
jgi:putative transposase